MNAGIFPARGRGQQRTLGRGSKCFFPLTTMPQSHARHASAYRTHEDVASAAAAAKRRAKAVGVGRHVLDLHLSPIPTPE